MVTDHVHITKGDWLETLVLFWTVSIAWYKVLAEARATMPICSCVASDVCISVLAACCLPAAAAATMQQVSREAVQNRAVTVHAAAAVQSGLQHVVV